MSARRKHDGQPRRKSTDKDERRLNEWVNRQRLAHRFGGLTEEQVTQLYGLPGTLRQDRAHEAPKRRRRTTRQKEGEEEDDDDDDDEEWKDNSKSKKPVQVEKTVQCCKSQQCTRPNRHSGMCNRKLREAPKEARKPPKKGRKPPKDRVALSPTDSARSGHRSRPFGLFDFSSTTSVATTVTHSLTCFLRVATLISVPRRKMTSF